ncbi:uncharacterized protein LOC132699780 [Cylas formicarius]|uniref:uncharacterized protein LOC132699780 n=1 Tax=Cylas formicarius TaxID=197179 RepID=UPI002958D09E|nr:uncharacterized protein LOC132699780 [Cylas formicarius]
MNWAKSLILTMTVLSGASAGGNDQVVPSLTEKEIQDSVQYFHAMLLRGYEKNRLKFIYEYAQKFSKEEETNLSFVASQNVYDLDRSLSEVRTIELSIPTSSKKPTVLFPDDELDFDKASQLRDLLKVLSVLGLETEISHHEWSKSGDVIEEVYVDKNLVYEYADGLHFVNKTVRVVNGSVLEDRIKELAIDSSLLSVLRYDSDGQFLKDASTLVPELLTSVDEEYNEPDAEMINSVLEELAAVAASAKTRGEVPSRLVASLMKKHDATIFYVTDDEPDGAYVSKDFSLTVNYHLNDDWRFTVYGSKARTQ